MYPLDLFRAPQVENVESILRHCWQRGFNALSCLWLSLWAIEVDVGTSDYTRSNSICTTPVEYPNTLGQLVLNEILISYTIILISSTVHITKLCYELPVKYNFLYFSQLIIHFSIDHKLSYSNVMVIGFISRWNFGKYLNWLLQTGRIITLLYVRRMRWW
jgi:hypothetical protein